MIIYQNSYFKNWDYVDKHSSKLRREDVVSYRIKVLEFWYKFGLAAALNYAKDLRPHGKCSRATLYRWRKQLAESSRRDSRGRASLAAIDPKSTRPHRCRLSKNYEELYQPIQQILEQCQILGKNKIHRMLNSMIEKGVLMLKTLNHLPSVSTIGRIVKALRKLGRVPHRQKLSLSGATGKLYVVAKRRKQKLRRDGYIPHKPGDLVQMDGIITYCFGKRIYILNAIDYVSAKAISVILPSNKARHTAAVLQRLDQMFGFKIERIQTDNGSEFMGDFANMMDKLGKTHFYNYVKKPMWNGKVERFNRTIQAEWLADPDIQVVLASNKEQAAKELQKYLDWYNNERPHQSLDYMAPAEYVLYFNAKGDRQKSQM